MDERDSAERAERLRREAEELHARLQSRSVKSSQPEPDSFLEDLRFFRRTLRNLRETWGAFAEYILGPFMKVFGPPLRWIGGKYGRFWARWAYTTDRATGERILSRRRAGILMVLTFLVGMAFTPTGIGNTIRFFTVEPLLDGFLISFSLRTETFYLNHSEEVDPVGNIHAVRGCHFEGRCDERDAVYFRVRPRLAHDFWKLYEYGNPIYVPDHVVAPIAPGVNRCLVTYYGYRITASWIARILRSLQVYPTMLDASCTHLGHQR